jgi:hypothetical protein
MIEKSGQEEVEMKKEIKEELKEQEKLLCPKAGTATSSPSDTQPSQSDKGDC